MTPRYFLGVLLYTCLIISHSLAQIVTPYNYKTPYNNSVKIPKSKVWSTTVRHPTAKVLPKIGPCWMTYRKPVPLNPRLRDVKIIHSSPKNIITLPNSAKHQLIKGTPHLKLNLPQRRDSLVATTPILLNTGKAIVGNVIPKIGVATQASTNIIPNVAITQPLQPIPIILTNPKNLKVTNEGGIYTSNKFDTGVSNVAVTDKENSKVISTTCAPCSLEISKVEDVFTPKSNNDIPKICYEENILNVPVEATDITRAIPTVDTICTIVVTPKDICTPNICNDIEATSNVEKTKFIETKNKLTSETTLLPNFPLNSFDESSTKNSINNLQNLKGFVIPQSTELLEPIQACLVGYDGQIFEIINEVQKVTGTEIEVHFYSFQKCKFNYISTHMINIKELLDILTKYNNYVCLNKDYVETYDGNKDCWYIQKLITAPSLYNNVDLHNHNIDIKDFKQIKTQYTPLTLNFNEKINNNNLFTKPTICGQEKEDIEKEIAQPLLENIITKAFEKECAGTIGSTNNIDLATSYSVPNANLNSEKIQTAGLSDQTLIRDKTMKDDIKDDQSLDIVLLESNDRNKHTNTIQEAPVIDCKEYKNHLFYDNKAEKVIKPISSSNLVFKSQMCSVPIETAVVSELSKEDYHVQSNESGNDKLVAGTKQCAQTDSKPKTDCCNKNFIGTEDKKITVSESLPIDYAMGTNELPSTEPHKCLYKKQDTQVTESDETVDSKTLSFHGKVNVPKIYPNLAILGPQKNMKSVVDITNAQNKPVHLTFKSFPISVLNSVKKTIAGVPETNKENIKLKDNKYIFQPPEGKQESVIDALLENPVIARENYELPSMNVDNTYTFEPIKCSSRSIDQYEEIKHDFDKGISVRPKTIDTSKPSTVMPDCNYFKPVCDTLAQSNQKSKVSCKMIPENHHFMKSYMIPQDNIDFNNNNIETLFSTSLQPNIEKEYDMASLAKPQTNAELNYDVYQPYNPAEDLIINENYFPIQASALYAAPPNLEAFENSGITYYNPSSSQLNTLNFDKDIYHVFDNTMKLDNAQIQPKTHFCVTDEVDIENAMPNYFNILPNDQKNVPNILEKMPNEFVFNENVNKQYNVFINSQQFEPYNNKLLKFKEFVEPTQDLNLDYETMPQMTDYYYVPKDNIETNNDIPLFSSNNLPINSLSDFGMSHLKPQTNTKLDFNNNQILPEDFNINGYYYSNQDAGLLNLPTIPKDFEYNDKTYVVPSTVNPVIEPNNYEHPMQRYNEQIQPETHVMNTDNALPLYFNILSNNQLHKPNIFGDFVREQFSKEDTSDQTPQPYYDACYLPRDFEGDTVDLTTRATEKYFGNPYTAQNSLDINLLTPVNFLFPYTYQNLFMPVEKPNPWQDFQYSSNSELSGAPFDDVFGVLQNNKNKIYFYEPEKTLKYEIVTPSTIEERKEIKEYSGAPNMVEILPSYDDNNYYEFLNLKNPCISTQYEKEYIVPNINAETDNIYNFIKNKMPWVALEKKNKLGDIVTEPYLSEKEDSCKSYDWSSFIETSALISPYFNKPEAIKENRNYIPYHAQFNSPINNENEQNECHFKIIQNELLDNMFKQPYQEPNYEVIATNTPVIKNCETHYYPALTEIQKVTDAKDGAFLPYTSLKKYVSSLNLQKMIPNQQISSHHKSTPENYKSLISTYTPFEDLLSLSDHKQVGAGFVEPNDINSKDFMSTIAAIPTNLFPSHQGTRKDSLPWTVEESYDTSIILDPTYIPPESKTACHSAFSNIADNEKYSTNDYVSNEGYNEINMSLLNNIFSPYKAQDINILPSEEVTQGNIENNNIKEINYNAGPPFNTVEIEPPVFVSSLSPDNKNDKESPNKWVYVSKETNPYCIIQKTNQFQNPPLFVNQETLHAKPNYYDQQPFVKSVLAQNSATNSQGTELLPTKCLRDNWIDYNYVNHYTQSNQPNDKHIAQKLLPILTYSKPIGLNGLNSMSSIKYTEGQCHQLYPGLSQNVNEIKAIVSQAAEKTQSLQSWPYIENKFKENSYKIFDANKFHSCIYPGTKDPITMDDIFTNHEENNNNYVLNNNDSEDNDLVKALIERIFRKNYKSTQLSNNINSNLPISKSFPPYVLIRNDKNDRVNIIETGDPRIKLKCVNTKAKQIKPKLILHLEDFESNILHIIPIIKGNGVCLHTDMVQNIAKSIAKRLNKDPIEMKIPFSNNAVISQEYMKSFDKDSVVIWPAEYLER